MRPALFLRAFQFRPHWRPYWALLRLAFQKQSAYRAANLAGFATNIFFAALRAAVIVALYQSKLGGERVGGYSLHDAVTYTGIGQSIIGWVALWGWTDLVRAVKSGDVATDLQRPVSFFWYWCAQDLGRALFQLLFRGVPMMLIYAVLYPITLPKDAVQWLVFIAAMLLAWLVSMTWRFTYSLAAFWTTDATGIVRVAIATTIFASGFLMPLGFFPPWVQQLLRALPFASIVNAPVEAFLNVAAGPALLATLGQQVFWAVALYALAHLVLALGVRRLTIDGG